jgi:nucleoside-diphosphate-sugar epimerase
MKAFVTGATGFIGGRLARRLRELGDGVVALVRSPDRARDLEELGCELVPGDLSSTDALRKGLSGCDACFHVAADYRIGVTDEDCLEMQDTNVGGTGRVIDAATEAGVLRIVYVSTIGVFGDTRGEVVDEGYWPQSEDFPTCYERTKFQAHEVARERMEKGAPVIVVQPGGVYGPGDTSPLGNLIDQTRRGRMKLIAMGETGFNFVHVDDVVQGILLAHDKGRVGESYVLGGEMARTEDLIRKAAVLSGRKPPRGHVPTALVRAAIPMGRLLGPAFGLGPNMREAVRAAKSTYWATDEKARRELGYDPRDLETGLTQTLAAS